MTKQPTPQQLLAENEDLRARLDEAEETLSAIRSGEVDALLVTGVGGEQLLTLKGADVYRTLIEEMSEGALTLTEQGVILYANRRFAEMLKMPLEKVIGATLHTWIAPDSQQILQTLLGQSADEKRREQLTLIASDGTRIPVYLSLSNQLIDGMPDAFCLVATDLTEQKHTEAILERANEILNQRTVQLEEIATELKNAHEKLKEVDRLKNMFISTMSHELRTPLNSIIGFSSIMLDEWIGPLNEEQKKNLATVHRSGQHLLTLINDVIDISRIEAGTVTPNLDEFDLHDVVSEAVNSLLPQIKDKGLEITVDTIHQPMRNDRRRLLQSVLNLLSNAMKFTEKGRIFVGAGLAPARNGQPQGLPLQDFVEITISDTGIGIKEEDMPKLFQSFLRIDSPLRSKVGGTGLGLYLTKKLITEVLKGEISVSSRYGEGSRFVMRIPAHLTPPSP